MRSRGEVRILLAALGLTSGFGPSGCGPSIQGNPDAGVTEETCASEGQTRCVGLQFQRCANGFWVIEQTCATSLVCDPVLQCSECRPGGRTCVGDEVHPCTDDGTIDSTVIANCDFEQCSNGVCRGEDCAGGTELIYVVDNSYRLLSFNPANDLHEFRLIGNLTCPAGAPWPDWPSPATPFSMSVDRSGIAWVLYDSGEIFWVDVGDASCQPSPFVKGQLGFELFGMGFVSEAPGSSEETLFIAGGSAATGATDHRLGFIDASSLAASELGTISPPESFGPELTGTGDAKLFGYYPGFLTTQVSEISKSSAQNLQNWPMAGLGGQVGAWAFAHWGGRFYIFVTSDNLITGESVSRVHRLDPATGTSELILDDIPYDIVGAGVSTCAPIVVN